MSSPFRVFNKGSRQFDHHNLKLKPGEFTSIPEEHVESVKKLLDDYPNELVDGGTLGAGNAAAAAAASELQAKFTALSEEHALLNEEHKAAREGFERLTNAFEARGRDLDAARSTLTGQAEALSANAARIEELEKAVAAKKK